jgi:parvulin-like peptidyl-prolyl isomerase
LTPFALYQYFDGLEANNMRFRIAILTTAMLALSACTNGNDSVTPPQALLQTPPANSQTSSLPADVALPPAPPVLPPSTQPASLDDAVATFNNNTITYRELLPVLLSANGFNSMLLVFERDRARLEALRDKITVTPDDIANEMKLTMDNLKKSTKEMAENGRPTTSEDDVLNMTPQQMDQLLDKALEQEHVTRAEFDVSIETNAILRKIAEPIVQSHMTDAALHAQFNAEYGEKVQIEFIVLHDLVEVGKARTAIKNGESFESVARRMSIDHASAAVDGKLEPFTLKDNRYPDVFKQVAFSLEVGQISPDTYSIGDDIRGLQDGQYILKLIKRIPPQYAKYEDYKDSVKQDLYKELMTKALQSQHATLHQWALQSLKVQDPILKKIWDEKTKPPGTSDPNEIKREMDSQHAPATMPALPASATMPATAPAAQ